MLVDDILRDTQALAEGRLNIAKERSKKFYDQKLNVQRFRVGQFVYLVNDTRNIKLEEH